MRRSDSQVRATVSVLDRLIDYEPEQSKEAAASRLGNLRRLKDAVRRDLEWLLNTRRVAGGLPPELKEVNQSVAAYGLPDFADLGVEDPTDQKRIRREVETAIKIFEGRLENVTVAMEPLRATERVLHFRIDARLKVEPDPEPITFDTMFQLASGQYMVREE
jgi:type VI secretion system protein ImpF